MDTNNLHRCSRTLRFILLCVMFTLGLVSPGVAYSEDTIAVLFPKIRGPYRDIFTQIIDGIKTQSSREVVTYGLGKNTTPREIQAWLRERDSGVAIVLGRRGLKISQGFTDSFPVVAGAVLSAPDINGKGVSGISLVTDPNLLFSRLRQLAPNVERVIVVYNPEHGEALIRLAKKAARANSLDLKAVKAGSLKAAAKQYQKLFDQNQLNRTALWLLQDRSTIDGKLILPVILEQAWKKKFVVFTSNPSYVRRGVLFSLYPDNSAMGKSLAKLAEQHLSLGSSVRRGMRPLQDLSIAINLRTAGHLGLSISGKLRREADLVFPAR